MDLPGFRHLVFASFVWGVGLLGPTYVCAQDCGGGGVGPPQGYTGPFGNLLDQGWDSLMTTWGFFAVADDPRYGYPVAITVNANPNVYAGSPTVVSSSAGYAGGPLIAHDIEYINAASSGDWTLNITYPPWSSSYPAVDNLSMNITYPSPGTYYVRGGVSVLFSNGENPWIYSDQETVTVNDPITPETVSIQTHPKPGMEKWVLSSHLVEKTFSVFHSNPQQ
jgi:hypothetical protein